MTIVGWLTQKTLDRCLELAEELPYLTVRGPFRMAPLNATTLLTIDAAAEFLDGSEPYGAYILRYAVGAEKVPHTDACPPHQYHERIVCTLQNAEKGGVLVVDGRGLRHGPGDASIFRADTSMHSIAMVTKGERIALTIGKLVDKDKNYKDEFWKVKP